MVPMMMDTGRCPCVVQGLLIRFLAMTQPVLPCAMEHVGYSRDDEQRSHYPGEEHVLAWLTMHSTLAFHVLLLLPLLLLLPRRRIDSMTRRPWWAVRCSRSKGVTQHAHSDGDCGDEARTPPRVPLGTV